jgi:hypothetical protein
MKMIIAAALAATLFTTPAGAHVMTGNEWVAECTSKNPAMGDRCLKYARGLADGLDLWKFTNPDSAVVCIPSAVIASQLPDIGIAYITANPADRHLAAGELLGKRNSAPTL